MAKTIEIKTCMMGEMFPMVDSLKCDKVGDFKVADINGKDIKLCLVHSNIYWGFFVLPDIIKQEMELRGEGDNK
jgi:hypothetical protein